MVLLQEELVRMELDDEYLTGNPEALNKMAVLAISYHNIGISFFATRPEPPYVALFRVSQ